MTLCKCGCGCGGEVNPGNKFILGHNLCGKEPYNKGKGKPISEPPIM